MPKFNNILFIDNVYQILKDKNMTIKAFEESIGLGSGYFARNKENATGNPGAETICMIADKLEISIDDLLFANYGKLSDDEKYLLNLISHLINITKKNEIEWKSITPTAFKTMYDYNTFNDLVYSQIPLGEVVVESNENTFLVYNSKFIASKVELKDNIYYFSHNNVTYYLTEITGEGYNYPIYELYFYKDGILNRVYCASDEKPIDVYNLFVSLYELCDKYDKQPPLKGRIRSILDELYDI